MGRTSQYLLILVTLLGVVSLVIGTAFIVQGVATRGMIAEGLRAEKVTLGIEEASANPGNPGNVVDTAQEAQVAQDILEEHLRDDYGTYGDTERGSDERATYLDGTILRNSLNLAIMGFGVTTIATVSGVFMIIVGIVLGGIGLVIYRLSRRAS